MAGARTAGEPDGCFPLPSPAPLAEESFESEVGSLASPSPDAVNHALWLARHVLGKRTEG